MDINGAIGTNATEHVVEEGGNNILCSDNQVIVNKLHTPTILVFLLDIFITINIEIATV